MITFYPHAGYPTDWNCQNLLAFLQQPVFRKKYVCTVVKALQIALKQSACTGQRFFSLRETALKELIKSGLRLMPTAELQQEIRAVGYQGKCSDMITDDQLFQSWFSKHIRFLYDRTILAYRLEYLCPLDLYSWDYEQIAWLQKFNRGEYVSVVHQQGNMGNYLGALINKACRYHESNKHFIKFLLVRQAVQQACNIGSQQFVRTQRADEELEPYLAPEVITGIFDYYIDYFKAVDKGYLFSVLKQHYKYANVPAIVTAACKSLAHRLWQPMVVHRREVIVAKHFLNSLQFNIHNMGHDVLQLIVLYAHTPKVMHNFIVDFAEELQYLRQNKYIGQHAKAMQRYLVRAITPAIELELLLAGELETELAQRYNLQFVTIMQRIIEITNHGNRHYQRALGRLLYRYMGGNAADAIEQIMRVMYRENHYNAALNKLPLIKKLREHCQMLRVAGNLQLTAAEIQQLPANRLLLAYEKGSLLFSDPNRQEAISQIYQMDFFNKCYRGRYQQSKLLSFILSNQHLSGTAKMHWYNVVQENPGYNNVQELLDGQNYQENTAMVTAFYGL